MLSLSKLFFDAHDLEENSKASTISCADSHLEINSLSAFKMS